MCNKAIVTTLQNWKSTKSRSDIILVANYCTDVSISLYAYKLYDTKKKEGEWKQR